MTVNLEVVGSQLRCVGNSGTVHWIVSIDDIILVAEYTTNEGPHADDYFLIFCTVEAGQSTFATVLFTQVAWIKH